MEDTEYRKVALSRFLKTLEKPLGTYSGGNIDGVLSYRSRGGTSNLVADGKLYSILLLYP